MADYFATAPLSFGLANSIAGLLVNPVASGATVTVKKLAATATEGRVPNAVLRRYSGVTYTPIVATTPPAARRVSSAAAAAKAEPTTSSDHTYSGGTYDLEISMALYSQLGTDIVLAAGESLAVVMTEDGSGAEALFAVHWTE